MAVAYKKWAWVSHFSNLGWVGPHLSFLNDVAKDGEWGDMEFTLLCFSKELVLQHWWICWTWWDCSCGSSQIRISQIDKGAWVDEISKDIIHQGLKDCWGISKAKGHDNVLKMPKGVLKVVFHWSLFQNLTRWLAFYSSRLVKTVAPWRGSKAESFQGVAMS